MFTSFSSRACMFQSPDADECSSVFTTAARMRPALIQLETSVASVIPVLPATVAYVQV